jgi:voltage-gated sodium channel
MKRLIKRFFLSETNMLILIVLSSLIICSLYFPVVKQVSWIAHLDLFFIVLFAVEAIVKLRVLKASHYFASNWNRFDFLLVLLSLPALLELFLPISGTSVLLILRLFRLMRVLRFIRFIPNLGKIVRGLGRALKASVFVLLTLILMNVFLALLSCHFFQEVSPEYFGNPLIASYSIFQMFTVEGWHEIPADLAGRMESPFFAGMTRFYFLLVVLIGGIFGLSLANAVFVDEMTMDNNEALEKKVDALQLQIQEIKELLQKKDP